LLLTFNEFGARLEHAIAAARQSVFVQSFAFEGDTVRQKLSEPIRSSPANDKRILADSFTRFVLSDRFRYSPANLFDKQLKDEAKETTAMMARLKAAGVAIKFTNAYRPTPRGLLGRNHKKLIVIDDAAAYVGGINFSEHNAAWHDMMLRIEDAGVVRFLRNDFLDTWKGRDRICGEQSDGLEMLPANGRNNRTVFQRVLDLIDTARESVFIESPYMSFPFYEHLREATRRGIRV